MKMRSLLILLLVALVLGLWAWQSGRRDLTPEMVGRPVFDDLPVNDVAEINITTPATNTVIRKTESGWVVADRFGYPAKFEKVRETLTSLRDLKIGQLVAGGEQRLHELRLAPPDDETAAEDQRGTSLRLIDERGRVLADVLIGRHFMVRPAREQQSMMMSRGYAGGNYMRLGSGPVLLVGGTMDRMVEQTSAWLDDRFVNVTPASVMEVKVAGPERAKIHARREAPGRAPALVDLSADEGTLETSRMNSLFGGLNFLSFRDVADPQLPPATTGLDAPVVLTARTEKGQVYTLEIGSTVSEVNKDRYVKVAVAFDPPASEEPDDETDEQRAAREQGRIELERETAELHAAVSPWIYVVGSHRINPMLVERTELIKPPEPVAEPEPDADQVEAPAGEPDTDAEADADADDEQDD